MNVLVMDVEGTDGRERGEDQVCLPSLTVQVILLLCKDFERKSALFSLASSEVLIVNLWEHQVGLYQGANMGLLKTVFEVNLGLFGNKSQERYSRTGFYSSIFVDVSCSSPNQRTLLLFVIRDHIGATPLANLQETLTADLQRIWDTLSKPAELKDRKLTDYFDLSFTALPHKILSAEKFESDVRTLRGRFTDKSRDDFVFKPAYHKRIPADGVAFYMEGIWVRLRRMSQHTKIPDIVITLRNKCKRTRTLTCQRSKNSLRNSDATRSRGAHWQSSTTRPNRRGGQSKRAMSSAGLVR
jgi:protein SEY1